MFLVTYFAKPLVESKPDVAENVQGRTFKVLESEIACRGVGFWSLILGHISPSRDYLGLKRFAVEFFCEVNFESVFSNHSKKTSDHINRLFYKTYGSLRNGSWIVVSIDIVQRLYEKTYRKIRNCKKKSSFNQVAQIQGFTNFLSFEIILRFIFQAHLSEFFCET